MKRTAQIISFVALALSALAPLLFFYDKLELSHAKACLLAGALIWFVTAPAWMEHKTS